MNAGCVDRSAGRFAVLGTTATASLRPQVQPWTHCGELGSTPMRCSSRSRLDAHYERTGDECNSNGNTYPRSERRCRFCIHQALARVNWPTSLMPRLKKSLQPVRYFMYRSYTSTDVAATAASRCACNDAAHRSRVRT
jgi:hypothetical protein